MMKLFEKIISPIIEEDEIYEEDIRRPRKPFHWVKAVKIILLCSSLLACLYALRTAPLEVFPGEEPGTHSLYLGPGCLPAVYVMFILTIVHSAFVPVLRWNKVYQKLLWAGSLPVLFTLFMPKTLADQAELAAYLFCREFGLESTVFHFFSSLYDFNAWFIESIGVMFGVELILFILYFIAGLQKEICTETKDI